jgi:tRNA A-37 threonylcarbamoyl transferase component Bud32
MPASFTSTGTPTSARAVVERLLEGAPRPAGTQELDGGPLRTTLRLPVSDQTVVVKLFHPRVCIGEWARAAVRPDRALHEFRNLERAQERRLPVPAPLDAVRAGRLRSALILEDLGSVTPLDEVLAATRDPDPEMLRAAGRLLRRALDAGLDHRDLHLGNLVRCDHGGELFLLDLHRARFRDGPVELSPAGRESLFLSLPWPDQAPLRRALASDLDERGLDPGDWQALCTRHVQRRVLRCRRDSGAFVVDAAGRRRRDVRGFAPPREELLPLREATERFESAFLLEVHGIPTARALALRPEGAGMATVALESAAGFQAVSDDERLRKWAERLRTSSHQGIADRLVLLRDDKGRERVAIRA